MSEPRWSLGEALTLPPVLAGLEPCEPCQGKGAVALPEFTYSSAFGTVHTVPKVVQCPVCAGSGTA